MSGISVSITVILCLVLPVAILPAAADSSNARPCDNGAGPPTDPSQAGYDERLVGVCHLQDTANRLKYQSNTVAQGEITFGIRSCSPDWFDPVCTQATPYSVRVAGPTRAGGFVLRGSWCSGGRNLPITLTYASMGASEELRPDRDSGVLFSGGALGGQVPASIRVELPPTARLRCQFYSAEFSLSIDQCGLSDFGGAFPCDGSRPTTRMTAVSFSIELWRDAEIRVSGLADMDLTAGGIDAVESSQDICVYGTPFLFGVFPAGGSALFRITADSQNGNGEFILRGVDDLSYEIAVMSIADGFSETLREGVVSNTRWRGHGEEDCAGYSEENLRITVRVPRSQLETANGNSYTDTVTLTVELE
ncbi:hypothetical protein [Microbulbifer sp. 2201CG32-9]|uniref:hypothetical protein n=1 Tax=unclassified Microbulbifer TaxID=2619833 RepID=UPI00345BB6B4